MPEGPKRDWSARHVGSGTFLISKPKRGKVKTRSKRIKSKRRAR